MEDQYGTNPYHNSIHAADVLIGTHLFLTKVSGGSHLSDVQWLSGLLAALIHDFNHPGTTNAHEAKVRSARALTHSDQSVLERHHLASAFQVMSMPEFNVLEKLSDEDYREARALIVELVLHTDLAKHFEFVGKLKTMKVSRDGHRPHGHENWWRADPSEEKPSANDFKLLMTSAIKFADLGHLCKPFQLHERWVERITQEFYLLGDLEREMGVPISALCDRNVDTDIVQSQLGFLQFVYFPFIKAMNELIGPQLTPYKVSQDNFWEWHRRRRMQQESSVEEGDDSFNRRNVLLRHESKVTAALVDVDSVGTPSGLRKFESIATPRVKSDSKHREALNMRASVAPVLVGIGDEGAAAEGEDSSSPNKTKVPRRGELSLFPPSLSSPSPKSAPSRPARKFMNWQAQDKRV
jgi:hypothetical protein